VRLVGIDARRSRKRGDCKRRSLPLEGLPTVSDNQRDQISAVAHCRDRHDRFPEGHRMTLALKIPHAIACLGLSAVLATLCHVEASAQSVQPGAPVAQSTPGPTASASPNPAPSAANPVPAPGAAGNPNGSPVVAPSSQPARSNASAAPVPTLPILDIVPIASFYQTASDPRAAFQQPQNVDINGTFRIPFGRIFSASFDRTTEGTLNSAASRVTNAQNKYIYPAPTRDVVLTYRVSRRRPT